jgi:predicted nucleic acid-binding protein
LSGPPELPTRLSIDSGVILAYYLGEELGSVVKSRLFSSESRVIYYNRLCVAELFYVLCRRRGRAIAIDYTKTFVEAGYSSLVSLDELDLEAGAYKCERLISLADCYVLAVAKLMRAAALFARREEEIVKEMKAKPLGVEVLFLEDYTQ